MNVMPLSGGKLVFNGMYSAIPANTQAALIRYVEQLILPGGFLCAVLNNDLFGAVGYADSDNLEALPLIVKFIYNELPAPCWGSKEKVLKFIEEECRKLKG